MRLIYIALRTKVALVYSFDPFNVISVIVNAKDCDSCLISSLEEQLLDNMVTRRPQLPIASTSLCYLEKILGGLSSFLQRRLGKQRKSQEFSRRCIAQTRSGI